MFKNDSNLHLPFIRRNFDSVINAVKVLWKKRKKIEAVILKSLFQ